MDGWYENIKFLTWFFSLERSLTNKEKRLCDLVLSDLGKAKRGLNSTYEGALPVQPVPLIITGIITIYRRRVVQIRPKKFLPADIEFSI